MERTHESPQAPQLRPVGQLRTNRSIGKFILFSILTLGIYSIIFHYGVGDDMNVLASRHDGRKTTNYVLVWFLTPITLTILFFVWHHNLSTRMGNELSRRGIDYQFSASTFWLWRVLGTFIIVGPWIYTHKLAKAMNLLAEDYNVNG